MPPEDEKPLLMIFPMELASHYLRCLVLCKRLESNFRIEIAASTVYRQFIDNAGLKTFKVLQFEHEEVKNSAANFDFSWLNKEKLIDIMESQVEVIMDRRPYAVLGDASFTLKMATERTATRFISLVNGYMTKYYGLGRGVPRSHPGYKYSKKIPRRMFKIIAMVMEHRSLRAVHEPFRAIRDSQRLRQTRYLLDEFEGDLNLVCDLPEFFPLRNAPPSYHYIGPLYYLSDRDERWILSFLDGSAPNVLVTMGSSGDWKKLSFLKNSIFSKYRFVLSGNADRTINLPNAVSRTFINHVSILPKIDLVICHGGNGTIYQALSFGVPVLSIPANFESEWNSNRIQNMGLGEVIESHYNADEIDVLMQSWIKRRRNKRFQKFSKQIMTYTNMPINIAELLQ